MSQQYTQRPGAGCLSRYGSAATVFTFDGLLVARTKQSRTAERAIPFFTRLLMKTAISLEFRALSIEFKSECLSFCGRVDQSINSLPGPAPLHFVIALYITDDGLGVSVYDVDSLGHVLCWLRAEMVARKTTQQPGRRLRCTDCPPKLHHNSAVEKVAESGVD